MKEIAADLDRARGTGKDDDGAFFLLFAISFTDITLLLLVWATYISVLFFAHIPFVVNRAFSAREVATSSRWRRSMQFDHRFAAATGGEVAGAALRHLLRLCSSSPMSDRHSCFANPTRALPSVLWRHLSVRTAAVRHELVFSRRSYVPVANYR